MACRSLRLGETINQNPHFLNQNHHYDDDEQEEHKETNKTTRTNRKERTR